MRTPVHVTLMLASLDIQHILPKIDEVRHYLSQTVTANVKRLCETFLHNEITDSLLLINNFNFKVLFLIVSLSGIYRLFFIPIDGWIFACWIFAPSHTLPLIACTSCADVYFRNL